MNMPMGYHVWDAMLERYQRDRHQIRPNCRAQDCFMTIWNDLLLEFIDMATVKFLKRLRLCAAAAGGKHSEHPI